MRTHRSVAGLLVVGLSVALGAAGCVVEASHDYSLTGSWTINGMPATAANCSAAGIAQIRVVVNNSGGATVFQRTDSCSNMSFDAGFVLDQGNFFSQWFALGPTGAVVGMSSMEAFSTTALAPGSNVMLAPHDFVGMAGFNPLGTDGSLSAEWQIDGATPSTTNCTAAGIANVSIKFYADTDTAYGAGVEVARATCASGKFMSEPMAILRAGTYLTSIDALDASGAVVGSYRSPSPLVVQAGRNHMLMVANFVTVVPGESLDIAIRWDTTVGPTMTDADCATAGVGTMTYNLMGPTGTVIDSMADVPCGAGVTFPDSLIAPGTYSIYIEGAVTGMPTVKNWMATCTGLDVAMNEHAMYSCFVDKVM